MPLEQLEPWNVGTFEYGAPSRTRTGCREADGRATLEPATFGSGGLGKEAIGGSRKLLLSVFLKNFAIWGNTRTLPAAPHCQSFVHLRASTFALAASADRLRYGGQVSRIPQFPEVDA